MGMKEPSGCGVDLPGSGHLGVILVQLLQVLEGVSHGHQLSGVWFGFCAAHLQRAHEHHAHHKSCQELAAHGECEEQLVLTCRQSGTQWPSPACVALIYSRRDGAQNCSTL